MHLLVDLFVEADAMQAEQLHTEDAPLVHLGQRVHEGAVVGRRPCRCARELLVQETDILSLRGSER